MFNLCESMDDDSRNEPTFAGLLDLFGIPLHRRRPARARVVPAQAAHEGHPARARASRRRRTATCSTRPTLADPALDALDYPWFVKLAHEDASLGITEANLVRDAAALRARAAS